MLYILVILCFNSIPRHIYYTGNKWFPIVLLNTEAVHLFEILVELHLIILQYHIYTYI